MYYGKEMRTDKKTVLLIIDMKLLVMEPSIKKKASLGSIRQFCIRNDKTGYLELSHAVVAFIRHHYCKCAASFT